SCYVEPNCQIWVNGKIFPFTNESFKSVIVQPVNFGKENCEYPIELAIINIIKGKCPLLFVNNSANGIHLQPNQLIAENKVPMFEEDFQQPKKQLVTIESPDEMPEAPRKDPYIA
uniref:Vitellogenin n=1 Tax=Romanomermis culicivorax TaxID=13658 RepID=A0A915JQA6_ROMCU